MKENNKYISALKKLFVEKEKSIEMSSFIYEITHLIYESNIEKLIDAAIHIIKKYLSESAVYLIDDEKQDIILVGSTIKNIPSALKLNDYRKFMEILSKYNRFDLSLRQIELTQHLKGLISFGRDFCIFPLAVPGKVFPIGIILIDIDLKTAEISQLRALNIAVLSISNFINYHTLIKERASIKRKIIKFILKIMQLDDLSTYRHSLRVKKYAVEIARILSLSKNDIKRLHLSSILHDVGKITVPYHLLHKESDLSENEFEIIKKHTITGYNLLKEFPFFKESLPDILNHHEKIDGSGYPKGIKDIDLITQVLSAADMIDAIASTRAYKDDRSFAHITEELNKLRGKLNPAVADAAIQFVNSDRFLILKKRFKVIQAPILESNSFIAGDVQERVNQLKNENTNMERQVKIYKDLLRKTQNTIEKMTSKTTVNAEYPDGYEKIFDVLNNALKPYLTVLAEINDNKITIKKIKNGTLSLEDSLLLFSNKKLISAVGSNTVYASHKFAAFPITENQLVCTFVKKQINSSVLEDIKKSLENITKKAYNR